MKSYPILMTRFFILAILVSSAYIMFQPVSAHIEEQPQPLIIPPVPQPELEELMPPLQQPELMLPPLTQPQPQVQPQLWAHPHPHQRRPFHWKRGRGQRLGRPSRRRKSKPNSEFSGIKYPPGFIKEFLAAHNSIRNEFEEPSLEWDEKLACYARDWGAKRAEDCELKHSYGPYGENLFWGKRDHWTATDAIMFWKGEREYYDMSTSKCETGHMCGHFTQIVWKDSLRVGCARQKCNDGGLLIICEYDPPGNYINESPFL